MDAILSKPYTVHMMIKHRSHKPVQLRRYVPVEINKADPLQKRKNMLRFFVP